MKKNISLSIALLLSVFLLQGCNLDNDGSTNSDNTTNSDESTQTSEQTSSSKNESSKSLFIEFNFNNGDEGFSGHFSDLPVDYNEEIYELDSGLAALPEEIGEGQGFRITGSNRSDDLFMFLKKELTASNGIKPNQKYDINFEIEFASNAFANSFGIGGSPAEAVYVKVGATSVEPKVIEKVEGGVPMYWMNIDKGQQSAGGADAIVIGNVSKQDGSEDELFSVVTLTSDELTLNATSSDDGSLWVFVGTDSGFEGTTELFYTKVIVELTPLD